MTSLFIFKEVKNMDQETEVLVNELDRLFGRLRFALMEAQSSLAAIADKAQAGERDTGSSKSERTFPRNSRFYGCHWRRYGSVKAEVQASEPDVYRGELPRRVP
jgi:hypothetical protein